MRPTLSVLRICSVFEPPPGLDLSTVRGFDPIGGMQNHAASLTRALDRLGVRQTVMTSFLPGAPRRQRLGSHADVLRLGWPITPLRRGYAVPALRSVMRSSRPFDVVHVHLGEDLAAVPLALAASTAHRAPVVLTVHCSLTHTFAGRAPRGLVLRHVGGALERLGARRAARVIVLTEGAAEATSEAAGGRVDVIPSGIEPALFSRPSPDPLPAAGRPRVVHVGRLAHQKGVPRLVEAMARLRTPARLVLVGDGPDRAPIQRMVAARDLASRTTITGFVPHDEVPAHLANADVVVVPSVYEELGSILLEAMASGTPVVGNALPGIRSVVRDGQTGVVCDCADPDALASAIDRALTDDALRDRIVGGGLATAIEHGWDELAGRVLGVYGRALRSVTGPVRRAEAVALP